MSAPKDKDIEIEIEHKRNLTGGITTKPKAETGGTTPSSTN